MAEFFIRRPIVAIVISIITVALGLFSLSGLSIEQYPFLAPPTIRVTATYPGASAIAVEQSVATPIEQEVNGVENMIYMKSSNTSDGRMQLDVNFEVGVDQDMANVLTQNRVSSAQSRLPQEVIAQGVTVKKMSPSILMLISLFSPQGTYDAPFLINYCGINLRDQLLRIPGIGPTSVQRILQMRRTFKFRAIEQLAHVGADEKRAAPFILLDGHVPMRQLALF